jgi:hypothetical protein
MPLNGREFLICFIWLSALIGYGFHDGGDPWVCAVFGTGVVLWLY